MTVSAEKRDGICEGAIHNAEYDYPDSVENYTL